MMVKCCYLLIVWDRFLFCYFYKYIIVWFVSGVCVTSALYLSDCGLREWIALPCEDTLRPLCATALPPTVTQHQHHKRCRSGVAGCPTLRLSCCLYVYLIVCFLLTRSYHNHLYLVTGRMAISSCDTDWQACHLRQTSISLVTALHATRDSLAACQRQLLCCFSATDSD